MGSWIIITNDIWAGKYSKSIGLGRWDDMCGEWGLTILPPNNGPRQAFVTSVEVWECSELKIRRLL